jgi:hypothetical protein
MVNKNNLKRITSVVKVALFFTAIIFLLGNVKNEVRHSKAANLDTQQVYLPIITGHSFMGSNWPQLGHDPQRTNYTSLQVDPPYCYTWKWYEAPIASRAQPVVAGGRLFIGSMNGVLYARDAHTGAPLWEFPSEGPVRHSAGVMGNTLVFSSYDGFTYGLNTSTGDLLWKEYTGPSVTAPLMDGSRGWVYVASSDGILTALDITDGEQKWEYDAGAPILTSPAMSQDGSKIYLGSENIYANAVYAENGVEVWRTKLEGQSLADRYPVVADDVVFYRSQPLYYFHLLLYEGDDVMDQAGVLEDDWDVDWNKVRPQIIDYLLEHPSKQTFFVLDTESGVSRGIAPVLYTYGNNDIPNVPVVAENDIFLTYRARHGIQTDTPTVHVTSKYDAELGSLDVSSLDITGLEAIEPVGSGTSVEFRMTSDEPAMLSMGGDILWVDNWERLGGINVETGDLIHIGAVSNDWPECYAQCGPGTDNPFFPLSGSPSDPAYPFPSPRVSEGRQRGGVVIANGMIYWHVIEAGLAGISHRSGTSCPAPIVWNSGVQDNMTLENDMDDISNLVARPLDEYISLDLTTPVSDPPSDLVNQLREEVQKLIEASDHLIPYYLERGFSFPYVWPYNTSHPCTPEPCLPSIEYIAHGTAYWHDPGEFLYSMALAYPYLDQSLQSDVVNYVYSELERYPPLQNLPWGDDQRDWLRDGEKRELYAVPFREELNNWPPPSANISTLYALWLWSKNTGDWSYAQTHWNEVTNLFNSRRNDVEYYADIAGSIGYARMASYLEYPDDYNQGFQASIDAMQVGLDFQSFRQRSENQYLDPASMPTGWSVPVFNGMTPEVGLYLREQLNGQAESYLFSRETGNGLRWWYLTRAGVHAEVGESSYLAPITAWSHFLAHAYIVGDSQENLIRWLDRAWGIGDLYSIQKIVATIQAQP